MIREIIKFHLDRYFGQFARKSDIDNLYTQLAALLEIKDMVGSGVPLGPFRGFAFSPDALMVVLRDIRGRNAPRVVEFGAGESTIAIAAALRHLGSGSLVTVEHDPQFREKITQRLALAGLDGWVDLRLGEMREYPARTGFAPFKSYDLDALNGGFDVAVVDGPIVAVFGAATRLVPLEWCASHLNDTNTIYLDDAARPEERKVVESLCTSIPYIEADMIDAEKGLTRLRRSSKAAGQGGRV